MTIPVSLLLETQRTLLYSDEENLCSRLSSAMSMLPERCTGLVASEYDLRKVMLDVTPGNGDGYEVFAKTADDIERKLGELYEKAESLEMERERLRAEIAELRESQSEALALMDTARKAIQYSGLTTYEMAVDVTDQLVAFRRRHLPPAPSEEAKP